MYATVEKLKAELGPPLVIDPPKYHNNFKKEDFMLLDNQFAGFVLDYSKLPGRLLVYKNRKGLKDNNISGVIVDNIQRVKERWDKKTIFELYLYCNNNMLKPDNMEEYISELILKYDKNKAAQMLWEAFEKLAIKVKTPRFDSQGESKKAVLKDPTVPKEKKKNNKLYIILSHDFTEMKLCKQAQACADIIKDNIAVNSEVTHEEILEVMNKYPQISEKQTPKRIFEYYRNTLKQQGVLTYDK